MRNLHIHFTVFALVKLSTKDIHLSLKFLISVSVYKVLFVIFINDLPDCVSSDVYSKIFRIITKQEDKEELQEDLQKWKNGA